VGAFPAQAQTLTFSLFERYLDSLREQAGIPGLSAAIVQNGSVVWERGLGRQDVDGNVPASPETPYYIGALSQTMGAALALRKCVEQDSLELSDRITRWVPDYPDANATVANLLTHTTNGGSFEYSLDRFAGLTSVILVMTLGQPRIFYSMARDGLMPPIFGRIHPHYRTPHIGTVVVGVTAVILAGLLPINVLGDLVSMGTLLAFATVCVGVLILRRTRPDLPRAFRVPAAPVVCILGAAACLYLFFPAFMANWHWMTIWLLLGFAIYFGYSRRHSKLNR
jgi:amino acid transporter